MHPSAPCRRSQVRYTALAAGGLMTYERRSGACTREHLAEHGRLSAKVREDCRPLNPVCIQHNALEV